jgi:hypothetical protein
MISDQTCLAEGLMKISRSAATMNGKFESSSNNYDESNLNRLYCCVLSPVVDGERTCSCWGVRADAEA